MEERRGPREKEELATVQEPRSGVKGAGAKSSRPTIVKSVNYECRERDVNC